MAGTTMNVTWESLLRDEETKVKGRLEYFDLETLSLYRGRRKAVRRTTGGVVNADPYELIVFGEGEDPKGGQAGVRIRVRFRDLKRNSENRVTTAEYVTHFKTVHPEELREPVRMDYLGNGPQRFLLDFGQGAVPVHVVHSRKESDGETYAYFVELTDVDHVRNARTEAPVRVRVYRVLQDVLRLAVDEPGVGPLEYQSALATYSRLKREGVRIVPEALMVGAPFPIPGGLPVREMQKQLKVAVEARDGDERQPLSFNLDEEEELVSFGAFEDTFK